MAGTKALIKAELLGWARNCAKVTVDDAAKAVSVATETLKAWEAGDETPTVSQLRNLAGKYHFPLAVFYLPKPPTDFSPLRDFRRLPDATDRTISAELARQIRSAHERRELALELHEDLDEPVRPFRLKASLADAPESVGKEIRRFLGVNDADQRKAARADRTFDFWRRKLEERDVLVFVASGSESVDLKEMRGFAIARNQLPVIVINGRDSQGGRCYTLFARASPYPAWRERIDEWGRRYGRGTEDRTVLRCRCCCCFDATRSHVVDPTGETGGRAEMER